MEQDRTSNPQPSASDYAEHLEALGAELEAAMTALSGNELSKFEDSVSRQQALCEQLGKLARSVIAGQGTAVATANPDGLFAERIRVAGESLRELNLRYAALLQHSSDSMRLIAGLCWSYGERYQPHAGMSRSCTRWVS